MKGTIQFIILGVLLNSTFLSAQQDETLPLEFSTGLLIDDDLFDQNVEMIPEFSNDGRRAADLPRRFSLRPFTPFPKNQGSINSCIGWAMGYAAMTTQRAFRDGVTSRKKISDEAHSAMFIYNQVKEGSCMAGAYVDKAAQFLKDNGTCFSGEFDFPYTDCDREPEPTLISKSQKYTIKDFVGLFKKSDPPKAKVMRTKRSISEGKPVVIGMRIKESLKRVSRRYPTWELGGEYDKNLGGHALCVVGYNDSLGVFEIMNSWGAAWGDGGFFRISYRDYTTQAFQGIQLVLPEVDLSEKEKEEIFKRKEIAFNKLDKAKSRRKKANENKENANKAMAIATQVKEETTEPDKKQNAEALLAQAQALLQQAEQEVEIAATETVEAEKTIVETELTTSALAGDFVLRMPLTDEFGTLKQDANGDFMFREVPPLWNKDHYELKKTNWEEGDMFQVIAKNIKKDSYVYLFSIDGNNKAEIHWPRNQKFEENLRGYELAGRGEGAMVTHSGAEILIPGFDGVLVRENLLEDHIITLYSDIRIDDFKARVIKLRDETTGSFQERFQAIFGDILIPMDQINFSENQMRVRVADLTSGKAIPVIVKMRNE